MNKATLDFSLRTKGNEAVMKASSAQLERAIIDATAFIDTLPFKGRRASDTQALSWPRLGVFRNDGSPVHGVPPEVRDATSLVAGFMLAKIPFGAPALAHVFLELGDLVDDDAIFSGRGWR